MRDPRAPSAVYAAPRCRPPRLASRPNRRFHHWEVCFVITALQLLFLLLLLLSSPPCWAPAGLSSSLSAVWLGERRGHVDTASTIQRRSRHTHTTADPHCTTRRKSEPEQLNLARSKTGEQGGGAATPSRRSSGGVRPTRCRAPPTTQQLPPRFRHRRHEMKPGLRIPCRYARRRHRQPLSTTSLKSLGNAAGLPWQSCGLQPPPQSPHRQCQLRRRGGVLAVGSAMRPGCRRVEPRVRSTSRRECPAARWPELSTAAALIEPICADTAQTAHASAVAGYRGRHAAKRSWACSADLLTSSGCSSKLSSSTSSSPEPSEPNDTPGIGLRLRTATAGAGVPAAHQPEASGRAVVPTVVASGVAGCEALCRRSRPSRSPLGGGRTRPRARPPEADCGDLRYGR